MNNEEIMALRIKEKRIEKGMTMAEFGKALGVQASAVNKWEHGYVTNIKRSTIHSMSELLEVSPVWLMGFDTEDKSMPEFEPEHLELIKIYSSLTTEQKKNVMNMLRSFVN